MRSAPLAVLLVALLLPWSAPPAGAVLSPPDGRCTTTLEGNVGQLRTFPYTEDTQAGTWRTWLVRVGDVRVPAPPGALSPQAAQERAELHALQLSRTPTQVEAARAWDEGPAGAAWERLALSYLPAQTLVDGSLNPPRVSRHLALLETAMFDALVLAWDAKYCHQRAPPSALDATLDPAVEVRQGPSYPSEHAVVAGAASVILAQMFPLVPAGTFDALADEAAESRIVAGANFRSDVDAGLALGRAVAQRVLAARADDGSAASWDGSGRVYGACNWVPTPPAFKPVPLEPMWGHVRPWVMPTSAHVRPPPPPACDSAAYMENITQLHEASLAVTEEQRAIALKWAGSPGSETPPGIGLHAALNASLVHGLSTMRHARVMAHAAAAIADAGIAAWDAKFTYWSDRPVTAIRRLENATWSPVLATPPFPGYVSGHSTFSSAGAEVIAGFFPDAADGARADAQEAALSRFYAGIHVAYDNDVGLAMGGAIGQLAIERATSDGAGP